MNLPKSLSARLRTSLAVVQNSHAVGLTLELVEGIVNDIEGDIMADKSIATDQKGNLAIIIAQFRQGILSAKNSLIVATPARADHTHKLNGAHLR